MKNTQKYLEHLIKKSINETMDSKANKLMGKIKEIEMEEGFDSPEIKFDRGGKDYDKDEFKKYRFRDYEFNRDYDLDSTTEDEFEYRYNTRDIDLDDELYGDEDDDFDFEVRDGDDDIEPINEGETCEQCGGGLREGECMECGEKYEGIYDVAGKFPKKQSFDYVEEEIELDDLDMEETNIESDEDVLEAYCDENSDRYDEQRCKIHSQMVKETINEKWKGDVEVEKTNEYSDMTIEEINSAIKKLKKQNEKFQEDGKKVPQKNREKMSELYFAKRAKQGWKGKAAVEEEEMEEGNAFTAKLAKARKGDKFTIGNKTYTDTSDYDMNESIIYHIRDNQGDTIKLTENEMVDLIENIVNEQKIEGLKTIGKPKGLTVYEKAHKGSGKENKEYFKSLEKKMKDYLKDGSKGKFDMNPKMFPQGNGELGKMDKKAFQMTDDLEDFNYEIAGQNFPVPDAIDYNEEWMEKLFKGDSMTGNAPGGNALESKTNDKFNKMRKKNTLKKLKDQSYKRVPQPVYNEKSGTEQGKGLNIKLETIENKNERVLNEEFERMKQLLSYSKKTQ